MPVQDNRKKKKFSKFKESDFYRRLKSIKNLEFIVAVFFVAVAVLVYSGVTGANNKKNVHYSQNAVVVNQSESEKKLQEILKQIDGVGEVKVYVNGNSKNEVSSVVVIASGAGNLSVKIKICDAVEKFLNIESEKISIYTKK